MPVPHINIVIMSNPLIHFPLYIGDTLKKFIEFPTLEERGAWLSIVIGLIENNGVLPNDKTIYYKCLIFNEDDKQVFKQVLNKCLSKTKKGYVSTEITDLIIKQKQLRDKRVKAGRIGGKRSPKGKQVPKQVPKQSESESESDPYTESESDPIADYFEDFWRIYIPYEVSKGSKKEAKVIFIKILEKGKISYEQIRNGVERYTAYCHNNNVKTKQVHRWLAKEGWLDEYPDKQTITKESDSDIAKRAILDGLDLS